jgi:RNA polymerase sigma factor (sigma-70 family)
MPPSREPQQMSIVDADEYLWLHHYCVRLMHDDEAGADLTQETLLEAWRHRDKLVDPHGRRAWLAQIAHNVALRLRRSAHRASHHLTRLDDLPETDDPALIDLDFVNDLERQDLATLLDHALALLPRDLRQALIAHYIDEQPQNEIATRLGISQGTLAVRLHRGRLRLQQLFATTLADEAASFGLGTLRSPIWQDTRRWCSQCGQHHLQTRFNRDRQELFARCPKCGPFIAHQTMVLAGARSAHAALERVWTWVDDYYSQALLRGTAFCTACRNPAPLRQGVPLGVPIDDAVLPTIHIACPCGAMNACPLPWLGLASPIGQAFQRNHRRIRLAEQADLEVDGSSARTIVFASVTDSAKLVIAITRDPAHPLTAQIV